MNGKLRLIEIAVFLCIILAPLLQSLFGIVTLEAVREARFKATVGVISFHNVFVGHEEFIKKFEKFYNDNFGLRDLFIRLKYQLAYSLFRTTDRVHIGEDDWLFYRNVTDNEQINLERGKLDDVFRNTVRVENYLRGRGIRLIIITNPAKNTVYPEYVPQSAPRRPNEIAFKKYRNFLNRRKYLVHIDSQEILKNLKPKMPVFHKTDFHWNDPAGFHIAKEMINTIGYLENRSEDAWKHQLVIERRTMSGGQARFIPTLSPLKETGLFVKKTWKDSGRFNSSPPEPYMYIYEGKQKADAKLLPATLLYGDSFSDAFLRSGYHIYFKKLYHVRRLKMPLGEVLKELPPDTKYIVVEHIESSTGYVFGHPFTLPQ